MISTNAVTTGLTTSSYVATSPSDAGGSVDSNTSYTVNFGQVQNLFPTSYEAGGITYDRFVLPDTLIIQRTDAGRQLIIFYEFDNVNNTTDVIDIDAEQQTNEEALYQSGLLSAGYDNILVNNATNFANVERIDIIYYTGIVTSSPSTAVFPIVERGGNDDIKVAAIRGLDANGVPNDYYPTVVQVNNDGTSEWGNTGISHSSLVFRRQDASSDPLPQTTVTGQTIHGSAVSFSDFGVAADEIVYGYSIFAEDVDESTVDITDISEYPTNTGSASGLDLIAGISTAVASDDNLTKATGPGGYKEALNTWLKANVGVTTATDESNVTDWQDQWLGDHDATTLTTAPTYEDDVVEDINFNPTVDFVDGVERGLQIANNSDFNTATSYSTKSFNIAFRTGNDVSTKQQVYEQGSNDKGLNVFISGGNLVVGGWNETNDGTGSPWSFNSISGSVSTETEYILTVEFDGNSAETGSIEAFLNGQSMGSFDNVGLLFSESDGIGIGDTNSQSRYSSIDTSPAASFYGSIPEFIYCNAVGTFSATQRNRIESYLALKYGITLDQTSPINYVNSNGDIIFNTTNAAAIGGYLEYNNDIAGIGRDDNSEFEQLSSQSENAGSIVQVVRGLSFGNDDTWLIWGNDAGATTSSRIVSSPETINERLERVWRVGEENSVGPIDISFDLTGLGYGTDASDFSLLIAGSSSGADFSSATVTTGGTFSGDVITFTNVDLSDGQYFTLGTQFFICTPGNVQDNLALWLKADAETYNTGTTAATNGQTVETWGDQGRNDFDATNDGGTTNRAPSWTETSINFNPALNWDAGTNNIGFNLGSNYIFAESANGGMHIFSAIEPNQTGNRKFIYDFGRFRTSSNSQSVGYGSSSNNAIVVVPNDHDQFSITPSAGSFIVEADIDFGNEYLSLDGLQVFTETNTLTQITAAEIRENPTHLNNDGPVSIGRQSKNNGIDNQSGRRFFGEMAEVIVYNGNISALEAQQVRSYLAIKYGSTLTNDNNGSTPNETISGSVQEGDYVASDGSTITFDYSDDTGFVTNVAGIGRDDDSCLDQKQSRSVNTGAIVTIGLGEIAANNASNSNSFDDDLDFFTWASDGAATASGSVTTDGTPGTVTERMLRVWRAQDTGDVGATDISFDLSGLGYGSDETAFQLIVANGGDNTSLENGSTIVGGTLVGDVLTFNDVNLTDGQYFTLGTARTNCGPGGVTTNLQLWLRADLGTNTMTNGIDVTSWSDQSGASNNASASNAPVYNTNNHNFNPSIDFTATNSDNMTISDNTNLSPDQQAVFVVGTMADASDSYASFVMKTASFDWPNGWGVARNNGTTEIFYHKDDYTANNSGTDYASRTITYDIPFVHTMYKDATDYFYSLNLGTEDTDAPNSSFQSSSNIIFLGANPSGNGTTNNTTARDFLEGSISEVIMFNDDLDAPQRARVASYLAIKYGITLDNGAGGDAGDYTRADGTNIWDASDYSTYHNDVAGIGRDDNGCFVQKQSKSVNDDAILAVGLTSVAATNADNASSFGDNGDYLVWGNDNGSTLQANANIVDVPSTVSERMTRVWRVNDVGTVGATELEFDLTDLGYSVADASAFTLLVSNTSTIADATIISGGTLDGNVLSFSGIDLTDGQFFTIGTALTTCGPGGVNTNIALWLRADEEVYSDAGSTLATDGQNVQQWNDQSSPSDNASEVDGGGGSPVEPTFETNEINYNPGLLFTDQNTTNNSYMETTANSVSGDMTLVAVFNTAQSQGSTTDFSQAPALIGANASGTNDYGLGLSLGQLHFNAADNSSLNARSTGTYDDGEPYIATGTRVQAASGAIELYANSANVASGTSDNTALSGPNSFAIGNHSTYTNAGQFQGDISEAIVFSSALNTTQRAQVESYLAIKYGITRDVAALTAAEQDYLAGDGGIIWDYDNQGTTYYHDIAGIGRDDLSCFEQPRSKSENNDALVDIEISSFTDDDSWLIWGNDDAPIEAPGNKERPATINSRLNREWRVQETGTIGTVTLTYDLSTITGTPIDDNNLNQVRLMVDDDGDFTTGVTLIAPTSTDDINKTVSFEVDFTTGQYYTLGSIEVDALPITLVSFNVRPNADNQVEVTWSTAQELNNAFFTIERSRDGEQFETVVNIEGAGNSTSTLSYQYLDIRPLSGVSFYRLKQTDFNGDFSHSRLIRVEVRGLNSTVHKIVPNPVRQGDSFSIDYPVNRSQEVAVQIINSNGQQLYIRKMQLSPDRDKLTIGTDNLKSGLYFVRVIDENLHKIILKLIVQ